ncbi:MAG: hypothetical protein JHD35_16175 [Sphingopyxis sp.]|nr:hypothetical protein [Sphingopyxis sp.]
MRLTRLGIMFAICSMVAWIPSWALTVGAMAEHGVRVQVHCTKCRAYHVIDPAVLVAIKGPEYSLVNRRCRCRLTEGCRGWNNFHYLHGVMRPLWVFEEVYPRWLEE